MNGELAEKVCTQGRRVVVEGEADSHNVAGTNTARLSKSDMMIRVKEVAMQETTL